MNISDFTYLLNNPTNLDKTQIGNISAIVENFPYFQSARAIQLKGLKDSGSFKYNQELKITAAHTTDRSILFEFITSDIFLQNDISTQIKQNLNQIKSIEINDFQDISNTNNNEKELKNKPAHSQLYTKNETQSISKLGVLTLNLSTPILTLLPVIKAAEAVITPSTSTLNGASANVA